MADEPAIEPAPAPEAEQGTDQTETSGDDPFAPVADAEPESFPREYVEKLRRDGARYRTTAREREQELEKLRPLADTFEGWDPEQVDGWREFLGSAREDPQAALGALIQQGFALDYEDASALLENIYDAAGETAPGGTPAVESGSADDQDRPLTLRDLQEHEAAKQAQADEAAAVKSVQHEAQELGYKPDAPVGSLDEARYTRLLHLAVNHGNDLAAAHEALAAEEQALVKQRMDELAAQADSLPVVSGGTAGAVVEGTPSMADARARATEFMRAQRAAQSA